MVFSLFWSFLISLVSPVRFALLKSAVQAATSFRRALSCASCSLLVRRRFTKDVANATSNDTIKMKMVEPGGPDSHSQKDNVFHHSNGI